MGKMRISKEHQKIIDVIKPFGYYIEKGKKHNKIRNAEGGMLIGFASTPSDRHAYKNVINDLIKRGLLPGVDKW